MQPAQVQELARPEPARALTGKPPFLDDQVHALMYAHATGQPPRLSERVGGVSAAAVSR